MLEELFTAGAHLAANAFLTSFELPPLSVIKVNNPAHVSAVTRSLRRAVHDEPQIFGSPKSRSAMLGAARNYFSDLDDREELLVALGRQHGSGARFEGYWLGRGQRSHVRFTPRAVHLIENQLRVERAEIMVVHNHPPNDLKAFLADLFGWRPLPSSQDRNVVFDSNRLVWQRFLGVENMPAFSWYLVDEGEIAEFYLPSVEYIATMMKRGFGR